MTNFSSSWVNERRLNTSEKIKENLRTQQPLKPRIEFAKNKIQTQNHKLNNILENLRGKEKTLFNQVVLNLQKHDAQQVKMMSNELAQIKRTTKMISQVKMSVEQIQLRLESTIDIGDVMTSIGPAVGALTRVRSGMSGVMSEVDTELVEVDRAFSDIIMNVGSIDNNASFTFDAGGEDVDRILVEASAVAEQKMNENFPDVPVESSFSNGSRSSMGERS
ncbi:MAG TPA: Snf7 family protein [Nitrososphaeraceae archaeon]|jgi:division protein CdvB (Snf7/Vps24/ESCRT-III family)